MHRMHPIFVPNFPFFKSNGHLPKQNRIMLARISPAQWAMLLSAPIANHASAVPWLTTQ
jgi:hypothetical protein